MVTFINIVILSLIQYTYEHFLTTKSLSLQSTTTTTPSVSADEDVTSGMVMRCFWFDTGSFAVFDLAELEKPFNDVYNLTELMSWQYDLQDKTILFNLCGNVKECVDEKTKQKGYGQFIYEIPNEEGNGTVCRRYGGNIESSNTWHLINESDINGGVKIKLSKGTEGYGLELHAYCANSSKFYLFENNTFNLDDDYKDNVLEFASMYACPKTQIYSVWKFIVNKKLIFASIMIVLGIVVMILGLKIFPVTIFIITCASVITIMFIFIYQYIIPSGTVDSIIYVVLAVSIIGGLFVSYVVLQYKKAAFGIILGIAVAIVVGQVLYNLVLRLFNKNNAIIQAAFYVVLIVIFAIVGKLAFKPFIIIGTSLVGSYALVRGVSIFIGGFPNESTIIDLMSKGETEQLKKLLTPLFYVYMAVWFVASIAASIAQFKINSEDDDEEINEDTESGKKKATKKFFLGSGGFGLDKM